KPHPKLSDLASFLQTFPQRSNTTFTLATSTQRKLNVVLVLFPKSNEFSVVRTNVHRALLNSTNTLLDLIYTRSIILFETTHKIFPNTLSSRDKQQTLTYLLANRVHEPCSDHVVTKRPRSSINVIIMRFRD